MTPARGTAAVAALLAAAVAGCGLGAGEATQGEATLVVTRDYGIDRLLEATVGDPPASETVLRFLDREADVETRYGGRFVQAIDGVAGEGAGGDRDWFFYVNGYWSPVGAAEARVRAGDRVWWDYRDWSTAYEVSAVVGSFPEPFLHGFDGERYDVRVDCLGAAPTCREVGGRLAAAGADPEIARRARPRRDLLRVVVGPWARVRRDPDAGSIGRGPARSGVFANFERRSRGWRLVGLDAGGEERRRLGARAGLVAAVQRGGRQPAWVVTGTDRDGVEAAADALEEGSLRDRYAVAARAGRPPQALPMEGEAR